MMQVREIMTKDPACCTPDTKLETVAKMMVDCDCGEIPVVESQASAKPVGVVTDRDITCRTVAQGKNPLEMTAADCMTTPCVTVSENASVEDCCNLMEEKQIRRVPVVDDAGRCCGMVAQADIAKHADAMQVADVVEKVSEPTGAASKVE